MLTSRSRVVVLSEVLMSDLSLLRCNVHLIYWKNMLASLRLVGLHCQSMRQVNMLSQCLRIFLSEYLVLSMSKLILSQLGNDLDAK